MSEAYAERLLNQLLAQQRGAARSAQKRTRGAAAYVTLS